MSTTTDQDRRETAGAPDPDPLAVWAQTSEVIALRDYLEERRVNVADLDTLAKWNVDGHPAAADFEGAWAADRLRIRAILDEAMATLAEEPYGAVRLLAYAINECGDTWQVSYHYEPLWATLAAVRDVWRGAPPPRDPWERAAGEALLSLAEHLSRAISGENSMTCGFLREAGVRYGQAFEAAVRATEQAVALREEAERHAGVRRESARAALGAAAFIQEWTGATMPHDRGTAWAAARIADFLGGGVRLEPGDSPLTAIEDQLLHHYLTAQEYPGDTAEGGNWSELRGQRVDLDLLREAQDEPWLYVDDGLITYVFPFSLRHRSGTPDVRSHQYDVFEEKLRGQLDDVAGWQLGGTAPEAVRREFPLDDVWHSTDAAGRRFDGVLIDLVNVTLRGPSPDVFELARSDDARSDDARSDDARSDDARSDDARSDDAQSRDAGPQSRDAEPGPVVARLRAEIRISKLGNHYLRFTGRLRDLNPAGLYAALRRPAPEHGAFTVQYGGKEWHRLSALAMELIADLAGRLEATKMAREGMFQVLVTVAAASTGRGPAAPRAERTDLRTVAALKAAIGAPVLFNPVSHVMTSLAEWIRYDIAGDNTVDDGSGRTGHALVRTCNTTVHLALGSPHWELGTAVTLSEFVASLDGLFAGWMEELNDFQDRVNEQRQRLDDASAADAEPGSDAKPGSDPEPLRHRVDELRRIRLGLQTFVTDCRSTIALVNSPALVRSPVVAANLAALVDAAGIRRRAEEFDRQATEILSDRLDEIIERAAREQEDADEKDRQNVEAKHRTRMDTLLAIIAAVGVSGLGQILQAGYGLQGGISLDITVGIFALAILVGIVVWRAAPRIPPVRSIGRRGTPPDEPARPGKSGGTVPEQSRGVR